MSASEAKRDFAEDLAAWLGPVLAEVGLVAASDDERVDELCDLLAAEARLMRGPLSRVAAGAGDQKCEQCDATMNDGEARTFTVCDDCWNDQYRQRTVPVGAGDRPPALNDAAIDAAEKAYWADDGVSRHNMAAAIRAYLVTLGDRPPAPREVPTDADWPLWDGWFSCPDCLGWFYGEGIGYDDAAEVCASCAEKRDAEIAGAVRPTPRAPSAAAKLAFLKAVARVEEGLVLHDLWEQGLDAGLQAAYAVDCGASPAAAPPEER